MKKFLLLTCLICLTITVQISGADEATAASENESTLSKVEEDKKDETKDTPSPVEDGKVVKKRQIYREQVLPHAGGKIPDTTFQTDRLILNRLQKEGIAVPDGVILEQRNPQVFPYYNRARRPVFKVQATQDGRYTPVEGRYVFDVPPGLETTYLYPQVHNYPLRYPPSIPVVPQYKHLTIPSPLATGEIKPQPISSPQSRKIYLVSYEVKPSIKASTASVLNIRNTPLTGFSLNQFPTDLITSQILLL